MWPYSDLWDEERKAVRAYLKRIWEKNNTTHGVPDSLENARREKDLTLDVSSRYL